MYYVCIDCSECHSVSAPSTRSKCIDREVKNSSSQQNAIVFRHSSSPAHSLTPRNHHPYHHPYHRLQNRLHRHHHNRRRHHRRAHYPASCHQADHHLHPAPQHHQRHTTAWSPPRPLLHVASTHGRSAIITLLRWVPRLSVALLAVAHLRPALLVVAALLWWVAMLLAIVWLL